MAYNCAQCANWRKPLKEAPCGVCKLVGNDKSGSEFKAEVRNGKTY